MLHPDALQRLRAYAARVDRRAPETLTGLYAVGSVALGDYRPPLSNLDVLAVSDAPWAPDALRAGRRATRALDRRHQPARVAYLTWTDLAADPGGLDVPAFVGRRAMPPGEFVNPLTWQVLRTAAVCIRGAEYPDVGVGALRGWAEDRLITWWAPWWQRSRVRPGALWRRRQTTEHILEVVRLSQIVSSGRVLSKLEAGELAVAGAGTRAERILKDAIGFRRGARTSMYWGPFERKQDALELVRVATQATRPT